VEIEAPDGYLTLDEMKSVTVVANTVKDITWIEISNKHGFLLPETGGIGTRIFTVAGMTLVAIAFVLLASKKRFQYCE
jgi:LPXTG-motif cell wall-anchored protein